VSEQVRRPDRLDITETDEYGLYSGGWTKKELTPESFSHPAKISRQLVRWIYDHAIEHGWLKEGDVVIDPFGGIGGCALDAMAEGAVFVGVELERHFVDMAAGCDCTGISQEDYDRFKGHYKKRSKIPQRLPQSRLNQLHLRWEHKRDTPFVFDSTEMAEWLCEYEDETDDIFDAVVWYDAWIPGEGFDVNRYKGNRHWCPRCIAQAKKAEREEQNKTVTDQVDMFSLLTPEWFTEPHHYEGNLERWARWGLPGRGVVIQGDSRELVKVLGKVEWGELVTSSPPYSSIRQDGGRIVQEGQGGFGAYTNEDPSAWHTERKQDNLGNMREPKGDLEAALSLSSPPFATAETRDRSPVQDGEIADAMTRAYTQSKQGESEGNLAGMEMGDLVVSSSPFAQSIGSDDPDKRGGLYRDEKRRKDVNLTGVYGQSEGQLGSMPEGTLVASSPPYEGSLQPETPEQTARKEARIAKSKSLHDGRKPKTDSQGEAGMGGGYGITDGQLGTETGDTFWSAARTILLQLHSVLRPGAHCIFVTKRFVRNKAIVDFSKQWAMLCESCGFKLIHWHRCWMVEEGEAQLDFDGNEHVKTVKHLSFFRRLHARKYPHLAIEWEDVTCYVRV